jgi:DNA-binding helix-hairpin-helix protein with protein kinase domain
LNQILRDGEVLKTRKGGVAMDCRVVALLGAGSQGEVYAAEVGGKPLALKWYLPRAASPDQRALLASLIRRGAPAPQFLWPLELVESDKHSGFGYLMALREPRFRGLSELMRRKIDPSFAVLARAGFELANSFLQLHSQGLCYRDISFGNLFLEPSTGEVLICDNDNAGVDGASTSGVLGTPRFMAPEVVRGETLPSTQTDLYSLAVLLFYLFMVHHPLEGRRELAIHSFDLPAMRHLYGEQALFIFDPNDKSNEPVRGFHDNALDFWPIYPDFLRELFTRSFTQGLHDPAHGRVREGEWRAAMVRLRDWLLYCQSCGSENFYEASSAASPRKCWSCGNTVQLPCRMRIGRHVVMLNHDTELFPHHLDERRAYDFSAPSAKVSEHPQKPGVWGLTNRSGESWYAVSANSAIPQEIPPGRSVPLMSGTKVLFGRSEGEMR